MHSSSLSPSLSSGSQAQTPAFELKFLVAEPVAQALEAWALARLERDPHGDAQQGGSYRTTTLYLDTAALDVFLQSPGFQRRKYRLRRYGSETVVWLERKIRRGDRVRKVRDAVSDPAVALLAAPPNASSAAAAPPAAAGWFQEEIAQRQLAPAALLTYVRSAFVGIAADGPVRLTLDRSIRGRRASGWEVGTAEAGTTLLDGEVVCELKFRAALPLLFKQVVAEFALAPAAISKYRRLMALLDSLRRKAGPDA